MTTTAAANILYVAQVCANRLQLVAPTSFFGSIDNNMILLKAILEQTMRDIAHDFWWPELEKEYTFTLTSGTAQYAFPDDFDRTIFETLWNRTQHWPLIGPLDAQDWQLFKSGIVTTVPRQRFFVKTWQDTQFFIDPTPGTTENNQTLVYEYITRSIMRPKTWVASTLWTGIDFCSYNGNIYSRVTGGTPTTGTTPPTWTSGAQSDGSITWTYYSFPYESINNDTDQTLLDYQIITDGAVWRFKQARGLDYQQDMQIALDRVDIAKSRLGGASTLYVNNADQLPLLIGPWSYPISNYAGS